MNSRRLLIATAFLSLTVCSNSPAPVAGSIAKPLSAAAALALVEERLLDLDQEVNDRLVSWRVPENQYTVEEKVTLRRRATVDYGRHAAIFC